MENDIARLTKEAMDPRTWSSTALVLTFLSSAPFIALFVVVASVPHPYAATAAYAVLFAWAIVLVLLLAWSRGTPTVDTAKRIMLRSGWFLRDLPLQFLTGFIVVALPILVMWSVTRPTLRAPPAEAVLVLVGFIWVVSAPIETLLQAWVWPMVLPFGPVAAQVAFVFLHGARAFDPNFAIAAFTLGLVFWALTYLRYVNWSGSRYFGPVAGWTAHATWNTLLIWVPLAWPSLGVT